MTLGSILLKYRKKRNLSIDELASKIPTKVKRVRDWEDGRLTPSNAEMERLVSILKIPKNEIDDIFKIHRNVFLIESTAMTILFMAMLILGVYFVPFYKDTHAYSILFRPEIDFRYYLIPYIALWIHFLSIGTVIVFILIFFLKSNYKKQVEIYKVIKYPLIISGISILFFMTYGIATIYVGYIISVMLTIILIVYYVRKYIKMNKMDILNKGDE